ncbi:DUF4157 domain-containing protein [Chitinophaga sp. G-6-1-13]|uniref:DUF4157 domain-containing protein n=1 Tax=Chitinophaga fulva TaxID=2728842 RepID=A0A848GFS6_9BACT|nr:DUF4157 domain-containing protein [Chitinophaga fulva]NML36667.1 DUF4157 domain-containing protein [Chitinophaga fulva]
MEKIRCSIQVDSGLARIAAKVMRVKAVAMVLGRTIHLYGASRLEFLSDIAWVRHEACHVMQYQQYGMIGFLTRYLYQSARWGYYHNPLEVAARKAEADPGILEGIEII